MHQDEGFWDKNDVKTSLDIYLHNMIAKLETFYLKRASEYDVFPDLQAPATQLLL